MRIIVGYDGTAGLVGTDKPKKKVEGPKEPGVPSIEYLETLGRAIITNGMMFDDGLRTEPLYLVLIYLITLQNESFIEAIKGEFKFVGNEKYVSELSTSSGPSMIMIPEFIQTEMTEVLKKAGPIEDWTLERWNGAAEYLSVFLTYLCFAPDTLVAQDSMRSFLLVWAFECAGRDSWFDRTIKIRIPMTERARDFLAVGLDGIRNFRKMFDPSFFENEEDMDRPVFGDNKIDILKKHRDELQNPRVLLGLELFEELDPKSKKACDVIRRAGIRLKSMVEAMSTTSAKEPKEYMYRMGYTKMIRMPDKLILYFGPVIAVDYGGEYLEDEHQAANRTVPFFCCPHIRIEIPTTTDPERANPHDISQRMGFYVQNMVFGHGIFHKTIKAHPHIGTDQIMAGNIGQLCWGNVLVGQENVMELNNDGAFQRIALTIMRYLSSCDADEIGRGGWTKECPRLTPRLHKWILHRFRTLGLQELPNSFYRRILTS